MKVSIFKLLWKRLVGGKEAVFDYLLDLANNAVSRLSGETRERLSDVYAFVTEIRGRIDGLHWLVPKAWERYYDGVLECLDAVLAALADGRVTGDELAGVVAAFQSAYAEWRAE